MTASNFHVPQGSLRPGVSTDSMALIKLFGVGFSGASRLMAFDMLGLGVGFSAQRKGNCKTQ